MNRVAIMQPYAFPYIGYFCLVAACDTFVFYDDVNYITRGWINRNRILLNGKDYRFTIPVANASQNSLICDVKLKDLPAFRTKFLKQIELAYKKARFFEIGRAFLERVMTPDDLDMTGIAIQSVKETFALAGISKIFLRSSETFGATRSQNLGRAERLISITKALDSSEYVNSIGGVALYEKPSFAAEGVHLSFVKAKIAQYSQGGDLPFVPGLSIIDIVMHNSIEEIKTMIANYELV